MRCHQQYVSSDAVPRPHSTRTQAGRLQLLHAVDGQPPTRQHEPLCIAALGPAKRNDALLGQHVEGSWVDALLVDNHKALVRGVAHLVRAMWEQQGGRRDDEGNKAGGAMMKAAHDSKHPQFPTNSCGKNKVKKRSVSMAVMAVLPITIAPLSCIHTYYTNSIHT